MVGGWAEHYCQGKWIKGASKDCPEPKHNVKLARSGPGFDLAHDGRTAK